MTVVPGHDATDQLPVKPGNEQQTITNRDLLLDHKPRRIVRSLVAEYALPQLDQLLSVLCFIKTLDQFLHGNSAERQPLPASAPVISDLEFHVITESVCVAGLNGFGLFLSMPNRSNLASERRLFNELLNHPNGLSPKRNHALGHAFILGAV